MNQEDAALTLKLARGVFFRAMLAGYAGNGNGKNDKIVKTKSSNGNEVTIIFNEGDFMVIDRYYVTPGFNTLAGMTLIFFKGNPIWWMSYGGEYPKEVIPFLKLVLAEEYRIGSFRGGRGPIEWADKKYRYRNRPTGNTCFDSFFGREEITIASSNGLIGFHDYQGASMIGHPPMVL